MDITLSNDIRIVNPDNRILDWAEESLILSNPEYLKDLKVGIGKHVKGGLSVYDKKTKTHKLVPAKVELFWTDGDILHLPSGCVQDLEHLLGEDFYFDLERDIPEEVQYEEVDLSERSFQPEAVSEVLSSIMSPFKPCGGILISPCGSGKTRMALAAASACRVRTLWLTHNSTLMNQSKSAAESLFGKEGMGTITNGKMNIGKRITFATVQTMSRIELSRFKNIWGLVIVDECHHCVGSEAQVTMFSSIINALNAVKIGVTATPDRADTLIRSMYALIGPVLYEVSNEDLGDYQCPVKYIRRDLRTSIDITECFSKSGTICAPLLMAQLIRNKDRFVDLIDIINSAPKPCLVLSCRLEHLDMIHEYFPDSALLKKDRTSTADITLATYQLVSEGYDRPDLNCIILATPENNATRIRQSVGRIQRPYPGKECGTVIDLVDICDYRRWQTWGNQREKLIKSLNTD
ncbi:MAG: DEAD/DEAH box helicase [Candidatus Cloacimonetes bacterium]|nr:DEAD/DEAH box helicase [Candidatus Cloacimonadota bacterium]